MNRLKEIYESAEETENQQEEIDELIDTIKIDLAADDQEWNQLQQSFVEWDNKLKAVEREINKIKKEILFSLEFQQREIEHKKREIEHKQKEIEKKLFNDALEINMKSWVRARW